MSENLVLEAPRFAEILKGDNRATHDAVSLLWLALNDEISRRRRQATIWRDVTYDASYYGATAGTWTVASGDQSLFTYVFAGTMMIVQLVLASTTTSAGMGTGLTVAIPLSLSAGESDMLGVVAASGAIDEVAVIKTQSGANAANLLLERADGSAWPSNETDTLGIQAAIAFKVG